MNRVPKFFAADFFVTTLIVLEFLAARQDVAHTVRHWIFHLGALGFIPLGLLDSSVVPVPGSMDVLIIVLASRTSSWWWWILYASMATAGSVLGAWFTYKLGRKGGEKALEKRVSPRRLQKVHRAFERWGFAAVAVPALLPPPVPMLPFLLAAGAMQYPAKKFLTALTAGRMARYTILAVLAGVYGRAIIIFLAEHTYSLLGIAVGLAAAGVAGYLLWRHHQKKSHTANRAGSAKRRLKGARPQSQLG
jgi:membrane protein DedA with SNARE-associated domain